MLDDDTLVERAVEADLLTQSGPHYYDAETEEHVGQGAQEAAEYLRSEELIGEIAGPEGEDVESEDVETEEDEGEGVEGGESEGAGSSDQSGEAEGGRYDASAYRYEGEQRGTFRREGRPDAYLYPGAVYNALPTGQDDVQDMIDEGILVPIQ
jgi:hypothetical protein